MEDIVHVKATGPFRGRINGRLIRLVQGDIVPPQLRQRALDGGWGEAVKPASPKHAGPKPAKADAASREGDGA